ncbi:protein CURVATURE THYLAKOID 1D, chloroplastic [Rhodamnia argentea]|uniref:Protein CURVATURE THYLAKOID 1D, chloroplastic n=1 Tax=Rhodamnia argentea TaxID=178133 RepID=A0A8B8P0V0_9MYRT|nr:protein CURVATURE THYLAKOID 1D, chloroplastic [Rhodamnia argentea]
MALLPSSFALPVSDLPSPRISSKPLLLLKNQSPVFPRNNGLECRRKVVRRATTSEDTSSRYPAEDRDGVTIVEEVPLETNTYTENFPSELPKEESPTDVQEQSFDLLEKINLKVDPDDTLPILLYAGGAVFALWLVSAVVGAIDSIPLFPKLMEVVGLGYTFWFTSRYLLFKDSREELASKIEELKEQVLGSNDD